MISKDASVRLLYTLVFLSLANMKGVVILLSVVYAAIAQQEVIMPVTLHCGEKTSNVTFQWMYDNGNGPNSLGDASDNQINITLEEGKEAGKYYCMYDGLQNASYIVGNYTKPSFLVSSLCKYPQCLWFRTPSATAYVWGVVLVSHWLDCKIWKPSLPSVHNKSFPWQNARTSVTYNADDLNRKLTCVSDSYPAPDFTWSTRGAEDGAKTVPVTAENNPTYEITSNGTQ